LRKNDEIVESESNDFIQSLESFQQELSQIASIFDSNSSNKNLSHSARTLEASETGDSRSLDLEEILKSVASKYATTKVVVNPEITQKMQAAETEAIAKYLRQLDFHKRLSEESAALKAYAKPATPAAAFCSIVQQAPLTDRKRQPLEGNPDYKRIGLDVVEIAAELKGMQEEIMDMLTNHDRLIESGRERLQKRVKERRMAAMVAREDADKNQAKAILSRQDVVECK
uniref:t-SNARE coiled-coil homology domain-containing protein n=1 Tax=Hydatigena taeniaeformis TaxID=6205 RepID=A0A0R3WLP4_HYDTA